MKLLFRVCTLNYALIYIYIYIYIYYHNLTTSCMQTQDNRYFLCFTTSCYCFKSKAPKKIGFLAHKKIVMKVILKQRIWGKWQRIENSLEGQRKFLLNCTLSTSGMQLFFLSMYLKILITKTQYIKSQSSFGFSSLYIFCVNFIIFLYEKCELMEVTICLLFVADGLYKMFI